MKLVDFLPDNPLFTAACALVAGEAAAFALPASPFAPWVYAGAAALALLAAYGWRAPRAWPAAVFLAGAALAAAADARLARLAEPPPDGPARPRVFDLRVEEVYPPRAPADGPARCTFRAHAEGAAISVVLAVPAGEDPPAPGEVWRCRGWLTPPRAGRARFDGYRLWAQRPGAAARLRPADPRAPAARLRALSDDLARRAGIGLDARPDVADLHRAMLLGRRAALPPDVRRMFVDAGTVHVFAISGLHVMVVARGLLALAALCFVDIRRRGLFALPLVILYTVVTGARPSAVRAAAMAALYFAGPALGRRKDMLSAWSAAALAVYALAPARVFDVGCTFSFTVMLGIALWLRTADARPRETGRLAALARLESLRGHTHRADALNFLSKRLAGLRAAAAVAAAAWAAGVPIAAHVFGRFTPGGLLANLAVMPLAAMSVTAGMAGLALSYVSVSLAAAANNLAALSTRLMAWISSTVAHIPGASVEIEPWGAAACVAWYAACGAVLLLLRRRAGRRGRAWMRL